MKYLRVDLKICEGCGALWLRAGPIDGVYCRGCIARLADFPQPNVRKFWHTRRRKCNGDMAGKLGGGR
jgi:hypothetical protein